MIHHLRSLVLLAVLTCSLAPHGGVRGGRDRSHIALSPGRNHLQAIRPSTDCIKTSPLGVFLRALQTPFVGEPLQLELTVHNGAAAGEYRWRIFGMFGTLDFGETASEWVEHLEAGESRVIQVAARVTTTDPFTVVGQMESTGERSRAPFPGEGTLKLFPFDASGGRIVAHWDPVTQRPLPRPGVVDPHVTLADGQRAFLRIHPGQPTIFVADTSF